MTEEERNNLVGYRLKRADETLIEAKDLIGMSHWHGAANRLYYACYYAASALLLKNQIVTQSHRGVFNQLGLHFVSKGIISNELGKLIKQIFSLRQSGDYGDWLVFTEQDVAPLLEPAQKFIQEMERLINLNRQYQ